MLVKKQRGFFGIGIINGKTESNIGTLWRSANIFGASFIFTIGKRYSKRQRSDTMNTPKHIPLYGYDTFDLFYKTIPRDTKLIGIEIDNKSEDIKSFVHPEASIYLLGTEDIGISNDVLAMCDSIIKLPGEYCLNVSVAGSIVMYDRITKTRI